MKTVLFDGRTSALCISLTRTGRYIFSEISLKITINIYIFMNMLTRYAEWFFNPMRYTGYNNNPCNDIDV